MTQTDAYDKDYFEDLQATFDSLSPNDQSELLAEFTAYKKFLLFTENNKTASIEKQKEMPEYKEAVKELMTATHSVGHVSMTKAFVQKVLKSFSAAQDSQSTKGNQ